MSTADHGGQMTDCVIPFQLEVSGLRGRIVRLNRVVDEILAPHGYPSSVNRVLAETVTLCALLSSMLKYEGIFTLQTSGDGPVSMLIADMTSTGQVRGCAGIRDGQKEHLLTASDDISTLLGKGYIAFTVDQGAHAERYQGIVELKGTTLVDSIQHYFAQSEQIGTGIVLAVGQGTDGHWQAQGIMLQQMPEERGKVPGQAEEDDWRRAMILLQSCRSDEWLDPALTPHDILRRLFHEEGVRVYAPHALTKGCRCDRARVESVLNMMSEADRRDMTIDGKITMTCEFCNIDFTFDPT